MDIRAMNRANIWMTDVICLLIDGVLLPMKGSRLG